MTTTIQNSPKKTVTVEQARKAVAGFGGGFADSHGRICGDYHVSRVLAAAARHGEQVTLETVDWKLRVGIA